jgi:predicted HAD superfamily phosphohydrolase YqeG
MTTITTITFPKMVVLDLDNTLISSGFIASAGEYGSMIRPYAELLLADLFIFQQKEEEVHIVLWSLGTSQHVRSVVEQLIYPVMREMLPDFRFTDILSCETSEHGDKNLDVLAKRYNLPRENICLVDDSISQIALNMTRGYLCIMVKPWDIRNTEDTEIQLVRRAICRFLHS